MEGRNDPSALNYFNATKWYDLTLVLTGVVGIVLIALGMLFLMSFGMILIAIGVALLMIGHFLEPRFKKIKLEILDTMFHSSQVSSTFWIQETSGPKK